MTRHTRKANTLTAYAIDSGIVRVTFWGYDRMGLGVGMSYDWTEMGVTQGVGT